nr:hypothetical protein Iba_chr05aCG13610 [Ipomoea batatas]
MSMMFVLDLCNSDCVCELKWQGDKVSFDGQVVLFEINSVGDLKVEFGKQDCMANSTRMLEHSHLHCWLLRLSQPHKLALRLHSAKGRRDHKKQPMISKNVVYRLVTVAKKWKLNLAASIPASITFPRETLIFSSPSPAPQLQVSSMSKKLQVTPKRSKWPRGHGEREDLPRELARIVVGVPRITLIPIGISTLSSSPRTTRNSARKKLGATQKGERMKQGRNAILDRSLEAVRANR